MTKVNKYLVPKISMEPSAQDMKEFGISFSKKEWKLLTDDKEFLSMFDKNLNKVNKIAKKILEELK